MGKTIKISPTNLQYQRCSQYQRHSFNHTSVTGTSQSEPNHSGEVPNRTGRPVPISWFWFGMALKKTRSLPMCCHAQKTINKQKKGPYMLSILANFAYLVSDGLELHWCTLRHTYFKFSFLCNLVNRFFNSIF